MRAFSSSRRGRPKKPPQPANDNGTPELRQRKIRLVAGAGISFSESPLQILVARAILEKEESQAGEEYARLYYLANGKTRLGYRGHYARLLEMVPLFEHAKEDDPEWAQKRRAQFRMAKAELGRQGKAILSLTEDIAVFQNWPMGYGNDFADREHLLLPIAGFQILLLRQGLRSLQKWFRIGF